MAEAFPFLSRWSYGGTGQPPAPSPFVADVTRNRGVVPTPASGPATASFGTCALLLLGYALVVLLRMPEIVLKGRFWAEEGVVYFFNGLSQPWYDALFAVHTGYINLAAGFGTLLAARLVPLAAAPWVSTTVALLIQLCPPILMMTSGIAWLRTPLALALAMAMLLIPFGSAEVWLNTITSQFHLGLCVALILALPMRGGAVGGFRFGLIGFAALSGPASAFLTPLFLVRAYFERSWGRALQGVILGAFCAVQLLMVILNPEPARDIGIGPRLLAIVVLARHVIAPIVGTDHAVRIDWMLRTEVLAGRHVWAFMAAGVAATLGFMTLVWQTRDSFLRWLLAAAAVVMTMSYFGALGHHIDLVSPGDRYSYVPMALFGILLVGVMQTRAGIWRGLALLMVTWTICTGLRDYFVPTRFFADGPRWSREVAHARALPSYPIQFWPANDPASWRGILPTGAVR